MTDCHVEMFQGLFLLLIILGTATSQDGQYTPPANQTTTMTMMNSTTTSPPYTSNSTNTTSCPVRYLLITQPTNITSPGYPANYANNLDCIWNLQAPADARIRINFLDFGLESHWNCGYDSLTVYYGPDTSSPVLEKLCGHNRPHEIVSNGSVMSVVLTTDHSITYRGFDILVDTVDMNYTTTTSQPTSPSIMNSTTTTSWHVTDNTTVSSPPCPAQSLVIQHVTTISSPGYPGNYVDYLDCRWHLRAPGNKRLRVSFSFMDVEHQYTCGYDSISFYDGSDESSPSLGKFCGTILPPDFETSGRHLLMVFHTDSSVTRLGFQLNVSRADGQNTPPANQTTTTTMMNSTTTSPPYTTTTSNSTNTTSCPVRDLLITQPTNITSPGYPANYTNNLDCIWNLQAPANALLRVSFVDMYLEPHSNCGYDSISFYDGDIDEDNLLDTFCGATLPGDVVSQRRFMTVVFHSDISITKRGFSLVVSPEETVTVGPWLRVGNAQLFSSAYYPFLNYGNNQNLSWTFTASPNEILSVYFLDFEMEGPSPECPYDRVILFDGESRDAAEIGTYCGDYVQGSDMISSTGPSIFLEFSTDGSMGGRGFNLLLVPTGPPN